MSLNIQHTCLDRFLKYVKVDTQSDPNAETTPSTEKQKNLGRILVEELKEMGIEDAHMDDHCYVYATIPANTDKDVPVICFCSHMDTAPDCSGKDVKPIVHKNYQGQALVLPDDETQVLTVEGHPHLKDKIGHDIVTASGTTLLGADNKAGLAEIMDMAHYFMTHPEVKHGKIRILFTPDEEIGRGVDKVDIEKLGADFGYTVDGEALGSFEDETFSADAVVVTFHGVIVHPGFAKGKLENALKMAGEFLALLPKDSLSPETTEGREGFVHPVAVNGIAEKASVQFIIRDFDAAKLADYEEQLKGYVNQVLKRYPNSTADFEVKEQYRNMKEVVAKHPEISENAIEAIKRSGIEPKPSSIRGGTDGSRLSFMGLPCPNIFAGEYSFHSKQEWSSVQDMQKATETLINLAKIWEEKAS